MFKQIAWNTFKKTGNINTFMEFKQLRDLEKKIENELPQSNPCGFASSLKEGAADKAEKFPALPRAPSQRGLSPKATGGVLFAYYLFFSSSSLLLALP